MNVVISIDNMKNVVKNTTSWSLVDLLCPYTCRGCGRLGAVLCGCCKNNILEKHVDICPLCKRKLKEDERQKCKDCKMEFRRIFVGGVREGALAKLVAEYKYQSVRAIGRVLAEILDGVIPQNWGVNEDVVVVPLPTIGKHVRQRGLDHTLSLAKILARRRGWRVERMLMREVDTVQVGTKAVERRAQAKKTYGITGKVRKSCKYLLLDDVWTTGASALAALEVMRGAGAEDVSIVVIEVGK